MPTITAQLFTGRDWSTPVEVDYLTSSVVMHNGRVYSRAFYRVPGDEKNAPVASTRRQKRKKTVRPKRKPVRFVVRSTVRRKRVRKKIAPPKGYIAGPYRKDQRDMAERAGVVIEKGGRLWVMSPKTTPDQRDV